MVSTKKNISPLFRFTPGVVCTHTQKTKTGAYGSAIYGKRKRAEAAAIAPTSVAIEFNSKQNHSMKNAWDRVQQS